MSLVFKKNTKKVKFSELHKLIFGWQKTGKTTLAAQMFDGKKEPLFVATEDGLGALDAYEAKIPDFKRFLDFVEYCEMHKAEVQAKHSCFIVDLVSDLDVMAEKYICEIEKVKDLGDVAYGKLYRKHRDVFQTNITKLMDILPCVFITHTEEKEVNYQGVTLTTHVPNMSKKNGQFINGKVDVTGFIHITKEGGTAITFTPSKLAIAGSRFAQLRGQVFKLVPDKMKESYENIVNTFNKKEAK